MKDFFGVELSIGDTVAFEEPKYRNLIMGKIVGFTTKQVRVAYTTDKGYSGRQCSYLTPSVNLIKAPEEFQCP